MVIFHLFTAAFAESVFESLICQLVAGANSFIVFLNPTVVHLLSVLGPVYIYSFMTCKLITVH